MSELHLPHILLVLRLHAHKGSAVIITLENCGLRWFLNRIGLPTLYESVGAARSAQYHSDEIFLLSLQGIEDEARGLWVSELGLRKLGSRGALFMSWWTAHPYILYDVGYTTGVVINVYGY